MLENLGGWRPCKHSFSTKFRFGIWENPVSVCLKSFSAGFWRIQKVSDPNFLSTDDADFSEKTIVIGLWYSSGLCFSSLAELDSFCISLYPLPLGGPFPYSQTEKYLPPLEKHTHTKTAFSNMVGSYFPWKMQVLSRFKVHLADIAEYTFNFLTSKSRFSRGCISVIVSVCFPNIVLWFFRMPSKFSHGCTIPCWNIGNICYQRGWGKKDTSRKSYPRHLYGKFPAGLVLKQVETVCFMCFAFFHF